MSCSAARVVAIWPPTAPRVASSKAFSASGTSRTMWPSTNSITKNGRSLTASSVHRPMVLGTGMPEGPSEVMRRCSRTMSCAVGSTWWIGGRRRTHARPAVSSTRKVRLERPPAIRVKVSGVAIPGTCAVNHSVTFSTWMP